MGSLTDLALPRAPIEGYRARPLYLSEVAKKPFAAENDLNSKHCKKSLESRTRQEPACLRVPCHCAGTDPIARDALRKSSEAKNGAAPHFFCRGSILKKSTKIENK